MPSPKPHNFDELTRAWNDPVAFARAKAVYYSQLAREGSPELIDITVPRRGGDER